MALANSRSSPSAGSIAQSRARKCSRLVPARHGPSTDTPARRNSFQRRPLSGACSLRSSTLGLPQKEAASAAPAASGGGSAPLAFLGEGRHDRLIVQRRDASGPWGKI